MSAYANIPLETLRSMLAEAIASRHMMMISPSSASSADGKRVTYERQLSELDTYINALQSEISSRDSGSYGAGYGPIVLGL